MMDSVDMAQDTPDTIQPDEVVQTKSEEITDAQGEDTEEMEVVIEGEDEQQDSSNEVGMTQAQLEAAWREEKRKRKAKNEEISGKDRRIAELEEKLSGVSVKVHEIARGPRPQSIDFADDDAFLEALEKWKETPSKEVKPVNENPQAFVLDDEAEFELHKSEESMKKLDKHYDDVKRKAFDSLSSAFGTQGDEMGERLVASSVLAGADPAKVIGVLGRSPAAVEKIKKVAQSGTQLQLNKALREIESMHKMQQRKSITTRPEESITGQGSIKNDPMAKYGSFN